ncbi:MAG: hypothetical protein HQK81_07585 [Desulfovibrionaceae bacterium]|nr:hypothetical protein [Desulfovibrionaceae bacterium]MBF0513911.1 hypothetical protein [Desulfovibrionaceae bacterium]
MSRHTCQVCGNEVKPHDFATLSPVGMVCGSCWAREGKPGLGAVRLDGVEKPARPVPMPEALALMFLKTSG